MIWTQFLKKDTRLSTGLQVLRKKITDLENLSLTVEAQVDRQVSVVNEKTRKLELLIKTSKALCERLESVQSPPKSPEAQRVIPSQKKLAQAEELLNLKEQLKKQVRPVRLRMVEEVKNKQHKFEFGKSPFSNVDFTDTPT